MSKTIFLLIFALQFFGDLAEDFRRTGFIEIYDQKGAFDSLYEHFDAFIEFLQTHPAWTNKLNTAKERFIHSKERNYYSTDFFGLYDETKRAKRGRISFYYSIHFHEFIISRYPEFTQIPQFVRFFNICLELQKPYVSLFAKTAAELGIQSIFSSDYGQPPILFKIVKYLPGYISGKPHYDGTAFSLFLDSTDNESLLLSSYKSSFMIHDFYSPNREFPREHSILLIPGTQLSEFFINPTPHIVLESGKIRYAAIAFAMRPNYASQKTEHSSLPDFRD